MPYRILALLLINLHKFHDVDRIGKEARDWFSVIVSGMIVLTSALGLALWLRQSRR